jgi:uncharacterized membrane protein YphA (DoxX/SURF4 family)
VLRAAVGVILLVQAGSELRADADPSIEAWITGGLGVVAGVLLVPGFLTPIAAGLAILHAAAQWIFASPLHADSLESSAVAALLAALAAAIALLGPGAFSIDARLFGLREIIIPRGRSGAGGGCGVD